MVQACGGVAVDQAALRAHVEALAGGQFAPRDFDHPENLDRAAGWIAEALNRTGATVREQAYQVDGRTYRNVLADFGPETPERIVVGAHYDTAGDQPGADDDASGVAGVLELARLLAERPPPCRVELAAWTLEEPPSFRSARMGSAVHAASLAAGGARVRLVISVEMIGAFSDARDSQSYPAGLGLFYPSTGNFIAVAGKWGQGAAVSEVARALRTGSRLPVETLSAPSFITGIDFSDHRSFWAHGYDAVMVTDTSFFRNERYHTTADRPETLDYVRMAEVVKGLHCAVQAIGSPR
jgi:Zn-dependent M28 family amino/carboxypeptidase